MLMLILHPFYYRVGNIVDYSELVLDKLCKRLSVTHSDACVGLFDGGRVGGAL